MRKEMPSAGPSRWYYVLAAIVFAVGALLGTMRLQQGTAALEKNLLQLVVPGKATVTLREPGEYTIFHEYLSVIDGKAYASGGSLDGLTVVVTSQASGTQIPLSSPSMVQRYSLAGRAGVSVLKFTISVPGSYEIRAEYTQGRGPEAVLTIGYGFIGKLFGVLLGNGVLILGSLLLAIAIICVVYIKRRKARSSVQTVNRSRHS